MTTPPGSHVFQQIKFISAIFVCPQQVYINKKFQREVVFFSYPSILTYVLGAQKNRLIETVLLSTHNICFGWEIRKLNLRYALLTKVLSPNKLFC